MKNGFVLVVALVLFAGCDQFSNIVSPKTEDTTPPSEVVNLVAIPGDGQVRLTWADPSDADFAAVQITAAGQTAPVAKGTQTATLTGLTNGADVLILVRTVDKVGNKSTGISVTSRPVAPPAGTSTTFTVGFDAQGGSAVAPVTGLTSGSTVPAPLAPTKSGFAFAGWFADAGYTVPWNFASDAVTADKTLYARWGSAAAVGVWFGLQNGLPDSVDPSVDDTESIIQFGIDGTFSLYQRRHAALASTTWANLDENAFYEVKAGTYFWNPASNTLVLNPQRIDAMRLALLSAYQTESGLAALDPSWTTHTGLKTLSQAQMLWGASADWTTIAALFDKAVNTGAALGTDSYSDFTGVVPTLEYVAPGQSAANHEVWQATFLDCVSHETRGGFRSPRAVSNFPAAVQSSLPALPTAVKNAVIQAVFAAYVGSPFYQGLVAAGLALSSAASAIGQSGGTSVNHSGTTGSVHWTNVESWSNTGGLTHFSGNETYEPVADQVLAGGITLLAASKGAVSYAGTSSSSSPNAATFTKNLGVWTLQFSGSVISTLEYTWDDVTKSVVGSVIINGVQSIDPAALQ